MARTRRICMFKANYIHLWCFPCFWTRENMFCLLIHVRKRFWKSLAPGRPSSLGLANKGSVSSKEWKFFMFPIFTTLSNFNIVKKENINKHTRFKYNFGKIEKKKRHLHFKTNIPPKYKKNQMKKEKKPPHHLLPLSPKPLHQQFRQLSCTTLFNKKS